MKLIVLGGFLGSGKTSILLSLAKYITRNAKDRGTATLVVIENEIGNVSIDHSTVESGGFSVRTINSGCICCSLSGDLISNLNEIHSTINPQWVIVEATGLAYLGEICSKIRQYASLMDSILSLVVVDGKRWPILSNGMPMLIQGQIRDAEVILLNKTDLISDIMCSEIQSSLEIVNPDAIIYSLSAKKGIDDSVWGSVIDG